MTLIARGTRAEELRLRGAIIEEAFSARTDTVNLPISERLSPDAHADVCLVVVRREQITEVLLDLVAALAIRRFVFMVNHANGSERILNALSLARVVLAFPGAAGSINGGADHYVEVHLQPTAVDTNAEDIVALFRGAGFRVARVRDMDAWLRRHAIFVTAIAGALYEVGGDARRLADSPKEVGLFIKAVREGWSALDRRGVKPAPLALRTILSWIPLPLAIAYWQRLLRSARGELYFAAHARHAPVEMATLVLDVLELLDDVPTPCLDRLYAAWRRWQAIAHVAHLLLSSNPCLQRTVKSYAFVFR